MTKKRVYELAKELDVDSKDLVERLVKLGVDVKNHMSVIENADEVVARLKKPRAAAGSRAAATAPAAAPRADALRFAATRPAEKPAAATRPAHKPAQPGPGQQAPARTAAARAAAQLPARPSAELPPGARFGGRSFNREDLRKKERLMRPAETRRGPQVLIGGGGVTGGGAGAGVRAAPRSGARSTLFVPDEDVARPAEPAAPVSAATPAAEPPAGPSPVAPSPAPLPAASAEQGGPTERPAARAETAAPARTESAAPAPTVPVAERAERGTPPAGAATVPPAVRLEPTPVRPGDRPAAERVRTDRADRQGTGRPAAAPAPVRPAAAAPAAAPGAPRPRPTYDRPGLGGPMDRAAAAASYQPRGPREGYGPGGMDRGPRPGGPGPRPGGGFAPRGGGAPGGFGRGPRPGGPAGPGGARPGGGRGGPRGGRLHIPPPPPQVVQQQQQQQGVRRGPGTAAATGRGRQRDGGGRWKEGDTRYLDKRLRREQGRQSVTAPPKTVKPILLEGPLTVKDLGIKMAVTATEIIKRLMVLGVMATINQEIDVETAQIIATELGYLVEVKVEPTEAEMDAAEEVDAPESLVNRPPVVTVMGHVDHGKTSLLDAVREARVAAGEAGGITQHIGAYTVELNGREITFLDTPGHEAFTAMRARGAQVTDVAVLVVAADDGVMPQTVEAINHAKAANVPMVVAINKIDKHDANPDRVKQELTEHGLVAEEWGGETIMVPVSAKEKTNLDQLLEMILLVADVRELRANPDKAARGTIIEAQLDKGRGPVATVLVQSGALHLGDAIVAGGAYGKVRAMIDDKGKRVKKAGPSIPVEVLGFNDVPQAGDIFRAVEDERVAREVAEKRATMRRAAELTGSSRQTLEDLQKRIAEGELKDLNVLVKADVQGSVEALSASLEKVRNEEVRVHVVHSGVGAINESDVNLAAASGAIIIGFHVRPDPNARAAAEQQNVDIRLYRVIYDAIEDIEAAVRGMLKPKLHEVILGRAEVRALFKVPKVGAVAGCYVTDGKIPRTAQVRLLRDNVVVFEGKLLSLRRFKDDVREVAAGFECGIGLENFNDLKEGDQIEAFAVEEVKTA